MPENFPIEEEVFHFRTAADVVNDQVVSGLRGFGVDDDADVSNVTPEVPGDEISGGLVSSNLVLLGNLNDAARLDGSKSNETSGNLRKNICETIGFAPNHKNRDLSSSQILLELQTLIYGDENVEALVC